MKAHLKNYRLTASQVAEEYYSKTTEDALNKAVAARYSQSSITHPTEEYFAQQKQELRDKIYGETIAKISEAQNRLKRAVEESAPKLERTKGKAISGLSIAEKYAKENGISLDQARMELDQYANTKPGGYGDGLSDRYAAIRNRYKEGTSLDDSRKAATFEEEELNRLGVKESQEAIKEAGYELTKRAEGYLRDWNTSGAALLRQMERNENSSG